MSVENLKSASVTNREAIPATANTAGEGGPGYLWQINDYALVSASASLTSTYRLLRVPCDIVMKEIIFESEAMAAGKFDIGLWYSNTAADGTPASLVGTVIDQDFFASDVDCASAVTPTNVTNESGTYTVAKRNQPLWQAVGLSANPGGFFDIVATVHTTAITTGAANIHADARYVW